MLKVEKIINKKQLANIFSEVKFIKILKFK